MSPIDILIVGAGPAGCAAAYDLAEAGVQVLLLDRRSFPRHKACACGLTRKTLKALRYSVDPIVEHACEEIVLEAAAGDSAKLRLRDSKPIAAMAVRERFDAFCLEQTLAAGKNGGGVTFRRIDSIAALRETGDGIELDVLTGDDRETLRAGVLIGADGSNGQTRRLAAQLEAGRTEAVVTQPSEAAWYERGFALEATAPYAVLPAALPEGDGPKDLLFDFSPLPGGYGWLFPKGDHINIGVGAFAPGDGVAASKDAALKQVTRKLLADYTQRKLGVDLVQAGGPVTGQYLGMGGHAYAPRGRVLLVGDAAGLVDPLTGEGIHSAVVSGQAAAAAVLSTRAQGFAGIAESYAKKLTPLQETLAFSERAARSFYREPERGFRVMRTPMVGWLALKTYTDGLPVRFLRPMVRLAAWRSK
ncbi:geranylgeranyl reductase family [Bryocella elongata]|uniref:Geranylgeranyl reductase family n=1 Tax=Bryocella elongata TaxID=863522 RepID=A0A1H6BKS2_9BACT|nr:geranylgeranyl reductase family protein [Bryocella elongata]SEG61273.1 geranylgeranyl reductase family [Bryocella elongata]